MIWIRLLAASAALLVLTVGCGDDDSGDSDSGDSESVDAGDQGAPRVRVAADGSCVWSGGEVSAGFVDIEFVNDSSEPVVIDFSPLVEGATIDDVIAAVPEIEDLNGYHALSWFVEPGDLSRTLQPGTTTEFAVALTTPGDYAVACAMTEPTINEGVPTIAPVALSVT